jgi:hypothetical protein
VSLQIVHDDEVPGTKAGARDVFDIAPEDGSIRAPFDTHRDHESCLSPGSNEREGPSTIARLGGRGSLPPRGPGIEPRQINVGPGLVDKDQRVRGDRLDGVLISGTGLLSCQGVLLDGPERLFFRVSCNRRNARLIVARLT